MVEPYILLLLYMNQDHTHQLYQQYQMRVGAMQIGALIMAIASINAFTPIIRSNQRTRSTTLSQSITPKEGEKILRREIAERNAAVDNEAKYSLRDAEGMQGVFVSKPVLELVGLVQVKPPSSERRITA